MRESAASSARRPGVVHLGSVGIDHRDARSSSNAAAAVVGKIDDAALRFVCVDPRAGAVQNVEVAHHVRQLKGAALARSGRDGKMGMYELIARGRPLRTAVVPDGAARA
jgi:hypothetical protein